MDVEKKQAKLAMVNAAIEKLKDRRDQLERELENSDLSDWDRKLAGKVLAIHEHTMTKMYTASTRIVGSTTYAKVNRCISHDRFGHIKVEVSGTAQVDISESGAVMLKHRPGVTEMTVHEVDFEKKFVELVDKYAALAHIANAEASAQTIIGRMRNIFEENK